MKRHYQDYKIDKRKRKNKLKGGDGNVRWLYVWQRIKWTRFILWW
jgi:hypothetical protein